MRKRLYLVKGIPYVMAENSKEFRQDYSYTDNKSKPSMGDIFQLLTIVYNIGHFYNTFTASRAITMLSEENNTFYDLVTNACSDDRYQNAAKKILNNKLIEIKCRAHKFISNYIKLSPINRHFFVTSALVESPTILKGISKSFILSPLSLYSSNIVLSAQPLVFIL